MTKQARSERTRTEILLAAARLFGSYGYRNISIAAIGAEAGVTTGAVYFHFDSKPNVANAIIELQHKITTAQAEAIMAANYPAVETMTHLSASLGRDIALEPLVRAGTALTSDVVLFPRPPKKPWLDWFEMLMGLLTRGLHEGDVRPTVNIEAVAHMIGPSFSGVQVVSGILTQHRDIMQRLRELSEVVISSFAAKGREDALLQTTRRVYARYEREVDDARRAGALPRYSSDNDLSDLRA